MKLTTEQIQQIELKLYNDYEFYYDDAKHEIIDHIASEIENRIKTDSFQTAFEQTFNEWDSRLKETEWSGMHFYGKMKIPVFYKQKILKSFRTDLMYYVLAILFFPAVIYLFRDLLELETINNTVFTYRISVVVTAILANRYVLKKYKEGKYTTVYGQIAAFSNNKTLIALLLVVFPMVYFQYPELNQLKNSNFWAMLNNLFLFNAFYFYYKIL